MIEISQYIKDIREKEKLSQVKFARKNKVPVRSYIRIEKGDIKSFKNIEKILNNYGLSLKIVKKV
ncbi:MAG: helix-turn-helix transcriptional regulator [Bacilli bacterium]|nr:helix-turn-helix transcriptional regulator [Bacilli bacterium]